MTSGDPKVLGTLLPKINSERPAELRADKLVRTQWQFVIDAAQAHYGPGKFTIFVAFEWSAAPDMRNLHRNVIFPGPDFPEQPFSSHDSMRPEDLWQYTENQRRLGNDTVM